MWALENQLFQNKKFELVKPWAMDKDDPIYGWSRFFLHDRKISSFVYSKPSELMELRIEFLVTQLCTKSRRWVICFSDSVTYIKTLSSYVVASFVFSTNLSAELYGPDELLEFTFGRYNQPAQDNTPSIKKCPLLVIPCFDFMHPGYLKARPKIIDILSDRKLNRKPFMFSLYNSMLPSNKGEISKFSSQLTDFFGEQANCLFSDELTKFVVLGGE